MRYLIALLVSVAVTSACDSSGGAPSTTGPVACAVARERVLSLLTPECMPDFTIADGAVVMGYCNDETTRTVNWRRCLEASAATKCGDSDAMSAALVICEDLANGVVVPPPDPGCVPSWTHVCERDLACNQVTPYADMAACQDWTDPADVCDRSGLWDPPVDWQACRGAMDTFECPWTNLDARNAFYRTVLVACQPAN